MMKRKPVILLGLILLLTLTLMLPELTLRATAAPPNGFKIIGYMPSWAGSIQDVQFDKLTHVNYAFMIPNSDGSIGSPPNVSKLNQLVSAAHANGVKVLMSIGGWNDGDDSAFEALAASVSSRTRFVDSMVSLINTYNLDGIDIDWEYPDPGSSADNYALLMNQLSQAMHSRDKLLTAAVVGEGYVGGGVKNEVFGYVDFLNIMSYDGGNPHASYAYAVSNLDYWQGRGLPANKTVLGVPFYARPGEFTYRDAVAADPQNAYRDCATVNGIYGCYNGIPTIQDKTELALQRGTGIMFWELSQDTSDAASLVSAIYEAADTGVPTVTNTPTTIPGANLALNRPATSSSNEDNMLTPDKAVDGSTTTRWASLEGSDPQWIYVDLGVVYNINRVVLNWEAAYGRAYQIQVSNNATSWTTVFSTSSGDGGVDDLTVAGNGRYVRMYGTQRGTQWGYSLWEFAVYGTSGSVTTTPTSTPVNTPVPTPTATPSAGSNVLWAGVRSSPYGISPFPSPAGWTNAITTMSSYFPGSTPVAVWLTGEIYFDGTNSGMDLNFPNPGGTYDSRLHFASTDRYESYLDYFDTHGIKVYLQVESGYAPIDDLIDANFRRYGHHPSVIGFGVDVEWYHSQCDGCANAPVGDALAQSWEATVKSYNPNYRLFLKHFDKADLPPTYRGDIIFIDDSEQNGSYNNFLAEMGDFADFFYPADVMFQIGYASDQSWWSQLATPIPQTLGQALASQTQQNCGIVWVDFTLRDVLPTN